MKPSYLPTTLLACGLLAAFLLGYVLRDAQDATTRFRSRSERPSLNLTRTARPSAASDAGVLGEDGANDNQLGGRLRAGIPSSFGSQVFLETPQRPSGDAEVGNAGAFPVGQSGFGLVPIRPVSLPTFFVPVNAGRPKPEDKEERTPAEPVAISYVVIGPEKDDRHFESLSAALIAGDKHVTVEHAETFKALFSSKANAAVLLTGRGSPPEISRSELDELSKRKLIAVGSGALQILEKSGSRIKAGGFAHGTPGRPEMVVQENSLVEVPEEAIPIFGTEVTNAGQKYQRAVFGYYIGPKRPETRKEIEVLAVWKGDPDYAPVVRDGNSILIGVNNRASQWSPEFGTFVRQIARSLVAEPEQPVASE